MRFIDLVRKRKSVRKYLDKPIPRKDLLECIEVARLAPSACNVQPWKFIIIDDKLKIKEVTDKICHSVYSFNKFIGESAALVIVVSDKEGFFRKAAGVFKGTNYYLIDIGIACEHLVLQAEESGIGTCWIGWFDERALKKTLQLSRQTKIDVVISLGYYDTQETSQKSRKQLEEVAVFYKG